MPGAGRAFWGWLLTIWLAGAAAMIAASWAAIAGFRFLDPDDVMRLVEVRDWLGGQSWFDVGQHRMNPPFGLSMHWSRLVDLPIAGLVALVQPFAGPRAAETIAAVIVPMLTLGAAMALVAVLTRRWAAPGLALLAAGLCPASVAAWFAMRPMRIDHHGWQLVAGLGIAVALTARPSRRHAALAGLCAALWTSLSLEGLPFGAAAGAWLGLRAIIGPRADADRLTAYLAAFTIGGALLLLAVKGPAAFGAPACDAMSPVHLAALGWATLASLVAARFTGATRLAILLVAAGADAAFYRVGAAACLRGPFATLGPLGYRLWYRSVNEGQPLWHASAEMIALWGFVPLIGLAGAAMAWRRSERDERDTLSTYIALLVVATGIGAFVMRAMAFANALALPGAMLAIAFVIRATAARPIGARIALRTLAILLCSPLGAAFAAGLLPARHAAEAAITPPARRCGTIDDFAALNAFAPTVVIVPIDSGPALIAGSHHRTITGPYHRDPQALEDVLGFFTSESPAAAAAIARARHARLLAFCPGDSDLAAMAAFAPRGLAARLVRGDAAWARPLPGSGAMRVYAIGP